MKAMSITQMLQYAKEAYGEEYCYNTVHAWLQQGKLKGFKRGGHWRIEKDAVDDFFCPDFQNTPERVCV